MGGKRGKGKKCRPCNWVVPVLLVLLAAVTLALRLYPLLHGEFLGPDSFYHASVVRNAHESGRLTNHNPLARCPFGLEEGPPRGMYFLPWLLSFAFPVKTAMVLAVLTFALLSVTAAYVLLKRLFSAEVALAGAFLFSVCFAFLQRSAALTFRGELFALPFFLLALYWMAGIFGPGEWRWKDAVLSGCMLGITSMVWNGFLILVAVYWAALFAPLMVKWVSLQRQKGRLGPQKARRGWFCYLANPAGGALLSLLASSLLFALSLSLTPQVGMGGLFLRWSWLPLVGLGALLVLWAARWEKGISVPERLAALASKDMVHWLAILALVGVLIFIVVGGKDLLSALSPDRLLSFGEGFFSTVSETQPLGFGDVWRDFGLLFILIIPAVPVLALRFDERRALFAGWLVASAALMLLFRRFAFLAALPLVALIALLAVEFVKSKRLLALLVALVLVVSGAHSLKQSSSFLIPMSTKQFVDILASLGERLPADACIVSMWDISSLVQWHAKLPTYTSSAGGQDIDRIERTTTFFLDKWEFYPGDKPGEKNASFYFLLREEDLSRILALNRLSYVGDIGLSRLEKVEVRELGNLTIYRIEERFYVGVSENETEAVYITPEGEAVSPLSLFIVRDDGVYQSVKQDAIGCLYIGRPAPGGQELYYFNREFCESNLAKMLTLRPVGKLRPLISEGGTILYGPESTTLA